MVVLLLDAKVKQYQQDGHRIYHAELDEYDAAGLPQGYCFLEAIGPKTHFGVRYGFACVQGVDDLVNVKQMLDAEGKDTTVHADVLAVQINI